MKFFFLIVVLSILFVSCEKEDLFKSQETKPPDSKSQTGTFKSSVTWERGIGISVSYYPTYVYHWSKESINFPGKQFAGYGTFSDLSSGRADYEYIVPTGLTGSDVIAAAISSKNVCYAWYLDGTASYGYSNNLVAYRKPYPYTLASGKNPSDIVGIAIRKSDDRCFAFYTDGT